MATSGGGARWGMATATCALVTLAGAPSGGGATPAAAPSAGPAADGGEARAEARRLSRKLDALYRANSSRSKMAMTVKTPHYERRLVMQTLSRGMDDTLVHLLEPVKERGVATLKRKNEMWNFLPKVRKTMRVPPSMMMGSWMGSDLTNDDMVRASSWDQDYDVAFDAPRGDERCLRYTPRPSAAVTWQRVVACFRKADELPTVVEYFDEKGRKARSMIYRDVRDFGGRALPATMEIVPHLPEREGHRTTVQVLEMAWDVPVKDEDFSQAALQRGL